MCCGVVPRLQPSHYLFCTHTLNRTLYSYRGPRSTKQADDLGHLFLFVVLARMLALSETTESTLVLCDRVDSLRALSHSLLASSTSLEPSSSSFSSAGRPYRDLITLSAASFAFSTFFSSLNLLRALTEAAIRIFVILVRQALYLLQPGGLNLHQVVLRLR
jgi:hypothetical protein